MKKLIIILIFAFPFYSYCQIINIPADYNTIQQGIDVASDGDTILVHPGTYIELLSIDAKNITLASLFLTTGDPDYINTTILDGDNIGRVITMQDLTYESRLIGFTVQNGLDTVENGGGIFLNSASPMISNMIVSNNMSKKGGGIFCQHGILELHDVYFINNEGIDEGGGIKVFNSDVFIVGCEFSNNLSSFGAAMNYSVGGMEGMTYIIDINSCMINNNVAEVQVSGILIRKNGGNAVVEALINESSFIENSCTANGALLIMGDSVSFTVQNCIFSGNTAVNYSAAGAFVAGCTGEIVNCLIASNLGSTGGGNTNSGGFTLWGEVEVSMLNCTFADNGAAYGAGISVGAGAEAYLTDCIFWGNANDQIALVDYDGNGGTAYVDYCDIQYGIDSIQVDPLSMLNWGDHNIIGDPMFLGNGDDPYTLADGSPCIDTGIPDTSGMDLPPFDLIGNIRIWDGGAGTTIIDMGAYEFGAPVWVGIENILPSMIADEISMSVYPNPCREELNIQFELTDTQNIHAGIYTITGRRVIQLVDQTIPPGSHSIKRSIQDLSPGIYFIQIRSPENVSSRKIIVL